MQKQNSADNPRKATFSRLITVVVGIVTLAVFWTGIVFLRNDVFKDYYNPARHSIVEQDPDTLEVYAWKDAQGRVYTRESASVRLFPYGITALILVVMGLAASLQSALTQACETLLAGKTEAAPGRVARNATLTFVGGRKTDSPSTAGES